jgi:hypothetical protein
MMPLQYEQGDELISADAAEVYPEQAVPPKPTWLNWLVGIGLLIVFITSLAGARDRHAPGVFLAFLNCLLVGLAVIRLAAKRSLSSIIPITFVLWPVLGWCVGTIYFAAFTPTTPLLNGSVRLQCVIMLFMVLYLAIVFFLLRRDISYVHLPEPVGRRLNVVALYFFSLTAFLFAVTKVFQLPGEGIVGTLFSYSYCLPLLIGAQVTYLRLRHKIYLIVIFCMLLAFFALANRRRYGITPIFAFAVGVFFLSRMRTKTKLVLLVILMLGFPTYMIIGNTVRYFVGRAGYEDFGRSLYAMRGWRYVAGEAKWMDSVFNRLFFTGGHAVITETPSPVPYVGFSPDVYLKETAISLIPGKIIDRIAFHERATYAGNFVLNNYGLARFYITREHQVGVTILGHFWLLGGYPYIIVGALIIALLQGLIFFVINKFVLRRPQFALFITACMMWSAIEMSGTDLISTIRNLFWRLVLGVAFYWVFFVPFLKRSSQLPAAEEIEEPAYDNLQAV